MWTFERYQRWMDQVTDWVRPPSSAALRTEGHAASRPAPALRTRAKPSPARAASGTPQPRPAPALKSGRAASTEDVIEVPAEEMDLAALAELAKKAIDRKS